MLSAGHVDQCESDAAMPQWEQRSKEKPLRVLAGKRWLLVSLIYRDIRSRYKQSILGVAWAILTPLAMTVVYAVAFGMIAKMGTDGFPPVVFYYVTMLPWTFFSQGIVTGSDSLVANYNLVTKIHFPREVFPIAAILGKSVDLALGVMVVVPLFIFYGIGVTWTALLVVPVLLVQTCFALGLAFVLSSTNLFYRDVRHVVPLLMTTWLYMVPIIYGLEKVPSRFYSIYMLDPMAPIVDAYRKVVLYGQMPVWSYLGFSAGVSVAVLVVGYWMFKRLEPAFAETV